jgi:hypothetical protein
MATDTILGVTARQVDELPTAMGGAIKLARGSGAVIFGDGDRAELEPEQLVAVGPTVTRRLVAGPDGLRVLCLGGAPGKADEAPAWTEGR